MNLSFKKIISAIFLIVIVVIAAFVFFQPNQPKPLVPKPGTLSASKNNQTKSNKSSTQTTIAHIFIIMDENQPATNIVGDTSYAPYLNSLISTAGLATNYSSVTHPSLPNYLAITSGSVDGTNTDCNPPTAGCIVNVNNIASEIAASGRTWKEYAESMPQNCYMLNSGKYVTKHNPFIYYQNIESNSSYCNSHVVPFTNLATDLKTASTTPNFAFITPNICNDMHSCPISIGDSWLSKNVPMILNSPAFTTQRSLLFITWDEGYLSNNKVAAIVAGSAAKSHYSSANPYSHYSILHTIEYLWHLKPMTKNDSSAPLMTNFIN